MAGYELEGTLKVIYDKQSFPSGFEKREFVVTTKDDRYPQDVKFELVQDRISALDGMNEGDEVIVTFDLRGNEYNGKYYVNLRAWKMTRPQGQEPSAAATSARDPLPTDFPPEVMGDDVDDGMGGLPF